MKEKQEKEEEEAAESQKVNPEDYEPKIAGISLKDSPEVIKFGYLIAIFAIFGGIIYWGKIKKTYILLTKIIIRIKISFDWYHSGWR